MVPPVVLNWAESVLGRCQLEESHRQNSLRTGVWRMQCRQGQVFLKLHKDKRKWHTEVFAYTNWAAAHGAQAPSLVAVYESDATQGLIVTALDGRPLKESALGHRRALDVYGAAGRLARRVHDSQTNTWFGLVDCRGEPLQAAHEDAVCYMASDLRHWAVPDRVSRLGCLTADEAALLQ